MLLRFRGFQAAPLRKKASGLFLSRGRGMCFWKRPASTYCQKAIWMRPPPKLFCHKNTVRYRLSKLHEILDPYSNDKEFHENLSIAVRIYMLSQFL